MVGHVDHHALAVLERRLADERAKSRLMVDGAESNRAKWRVDFDALGGVGEFLAIGRLGLGEDRRSASLCSATLRILLCKNRSRMLTVASARQARANRKLAPIAKAFGS